jgi:hypothetical protein
MEHRYNSNMPRLQCNILYHIFIFVFSKSVGLFLVSYKTSDLVRTTLDLDKGSICHLGTVMDEMVPWW